MKANKNIEDILPLSPLQGGILFHALYAPGTAVYFEQFVCRLRGRLDRAAFAGTWQTLVARHAALRTAFVTKGERGPVQVVFRSLPFQTRELDWSGLEESERSRRLAEYLEQDRAEGFVFNRPPLMRVTLVRVAEDSWQFVWSHHHILLDGWSLTLLVREFFLIYHGLAEGHGPQLPARAPFGDYVKWLGRQDRSRAERFWRGYLEGFEGPTAVGVVGPRAGVGPDVRQENHHAYFSPEETARIEAFARAQRLTPSTLFQAAWALLLSRYGGGEDIVFGVTLSGRSAPLPGVEQMVGLFVNSLPLRVRVRGHARLGDWLREIQDGNADLQHYEYCDLTDVQRWSSVPRGRPLFESLLAFENYPAEAPTDGAGLRVESAELIESTHFPLVAVVVPGESLRLKISYDANRVTHESARGLAGHLRRLVMQMTEGADLPLAAFTLSDTPAPAPRAQDAHAVGTLGESFTASAAAHASRVAVSFDGERVTYGQLADEAGRLAALLSRLGVGAETRVGVCMERSTRQIAAMLAVVQAGGAYVPLDPAYPPERLAYMIEDSACRLVLTTADLRPRLLGTGCETLCVEECETGGEAPTPPPPALSPDNAAYVIYTSGSTGRPKGVVVTHRNVLRLFASCGEHFRFEAEDVWTYFHSFSFDFSVWEIWGALLHGARVVVVPYLLSRDPAAFYRLLAAEGVTVLSQTPSAFRQLTAHEQALEEAAPLRLRYVVFGGEALDPQTLRPWFERHADDRTRLVNMYGITETTVHVTFRPVTPGDVRAGSPSLIGRPLEDLEIHLLDEYGHAVPQGVRGEICVGGPGLARGYLNQPGATAAKFTPHPFAAGERLYRSGDLARLTPDGDLEYCGRADTQVKVRGFRIETAEVAAALLRHENVREATARVYAGSEGDARLAAYAVCKNGRRPGVEELRDFLRQHLPDHMLPDAFVFCDAFPLTLNGKLDTDALPDPSLAREEVSEQYVEPAEGVERELADIWRRVLGVERVGRNDNFFALGGDSIRSISVTSSAKDRGIVFSIQQLFEHQTVGRLAAALNGAGKAGAAEEGPRRVAPFALVDPSDRPRLPEDLEDAYPLARLQAGMLFHSDYGDGERTYQDAFSFRLRLDFDEHRWRAALEKLMAAHPVLRTSFHFAGLKEPLQFVQRTATAPLEVSDLRGLSEAGQDAYLEEWLGRQLKEGFDWGRAPLFRMFVHRLRDDVIELSCVVHHAILDGWSAATFFKELAETYLSPSGQVAAPAETFREFVALEAEALASESQRGFWRETLTDPPETRLPRWPARADERGAGHRRGFAHRPLGAGLSEKILALARSAGLPVKSVLLAAHLRVLQLLTGGEEVLTGLVTNGRPGGGDGTRVLGLFLNTLPLRFRLPACSWLELCRAVLGAETALLEYRRFPLSEITRLNGNAAPFETSFNFVNFHVYEGLAGRGPVELLGTKSFEQVDIPFSANFSLGVTDARLSLGLMYDREQFPDAQADAIADHYERALASLVADPSAPHADADLLGEDERRRLLVEFNDTARPLATPLFVHEWVGRRAAETPSATAVVFEGRRWSYAELEGRATRLARLLMSKGVGPDTTVALLAERSFEMVCALLAVLKVGGAYVPLDPEAPAERVAAVLQDSRAPLLLTQESLKGRVPRSFDGEAVVFERCGAELEALPDDAPEVRLHAGNLAYVLFTSGSTGRPKGVAVTHEGLANHMQWMLEAFPLTPEDAVLQKTPYGFDASVWEFWAPLMAGARLVLARPGGQQDPAYLVKEIRERRVTTLQLVPTMLEVLLGEEGFARCDTLRRLFVGGEALKTHAASRVRRLLGVPVVNLYGPTETTIQTSAGLFDEDEPQATVNIGTPIYNARYYVLDGGLRPVPRGAAGELYIGGLCLARGYLARPGLTAERFVPDPFGAEPGARLYRTGDRVRLLPAGSLEYLGRTDRQLKLRGFRVELADVEAALAALPGVRRSAAALKQTHAGGPRLVAYYQTANGAALAPDDIKRHLRARLPAYMVPTAFQRIEQWPLLASGKTDFAALPTPEPSLEGAEGASREASTERERVLAEVWQKVLRVARVGADEDFFALGGDSILSLQIVAEARRRGLDFTPQQLFDNPTVAALALVVGAAETPAAAQTAPAGEVPLAPIQRFFFEQNLPNVNHWNQAVLLEVAPQYAAEQVRGALASVVSRHDAFRLRFRQDAGGWRQFYAEAGGPPAFDVVDLSDVPDAQKEQRYEAACNAAQSSLNIEDGPLVRAAYFKLDDEGAARLLVVCHHLVVDGVSWRILLEDLQAELERPGERAGAGPPFGAWARRVAELSPGEFAGEEDFWARQEERARTPLPTDYAHAAEANTQGSAAVVERLLTAEETRALVVAAPRHLRASAAEVLLASLAEAVTDWTGGHDLTVSLEGHGREPLFDGVDLSRTVGWFTSLYPLRVETLKGGDASARLASVKRQARLVPRGGVGYGLLRYTGAPPAASPTRAALPQISLNYLGQFDNSFREGGALRIAEGTTGDSVDPASPRTHLLDVVALVVNGRLALRLNYSRAAHRAETIERLAESVSESLRRYARAAQAPDPASWVAEDFRLARLDDAELAELLAGGEDFEDVWPLAPVQEGMLFHTLEEGAGGGVYVQQLTGELRGELDTGAMREAWDDVLARHPNLRASFAWEGLRRPLQKIPGSASVPFKLLDWRAHAPSERRQMLERFLAEDRREGFDLRRGPLMRFALVRLEDDAWQLVWTHHHILLDGWSLPLILSQFVEAYRARREGRETEAKAVAPYARYLSWLQRRDAAEAEEFWRGYLSGYVEPTLLAPAAEGAGRADETAESGRVELNIDERLSEQLRDFARRRRLTVNNVIQAAWGFVLCRHARTREVVYGVTVSGRPPDLPGAEETVGLFINTLPLRVEVSPGRSIDEWLSSLQAAQTGLLRFQHNRLIDIAGWSEVPRGRPLFDTILVFENYPVEDALRSGAGDFSAEMLTTLEQNNYPLTLYVTPGRELKLACAFQTRVAERLNPHTLLTHLGRVVRRLVEREGGRLSDLELTTEEERRLVTETWNDTAVDYDRELLVPERFARAAARDPRKTAVVFGDERVSYGELDETSDRLARRLQELGARPEARVGLLLERTPRLVCALLAVLKSGAAYVPLDPSFPKARLRQIVEEAEPDLFVTESELSDALPEASARSLLLDLEWAEIKGRPGAPAPSGACSRNLAYLIFTSGSTGRPKGVQIPHGAITNALESFRRRPGLSERDVFAAVTTVSFDIAALELFLPLLAGATLALVPRDVASDGVGLARLLAETKATSMQATPVTWRMLLAAGWTPPGQGFAAWCGGEALPHDLAAALLERGVTLWNLYGPTETTIWSTVQEVRADQPSVLIGSPVNNTQVYVLDDAGNPLPPGVAGELYIGGEGLARGYLNLPAMTAEKLVPDPFSKRPGARLYRTGDLAAFKDGGALEYFGRADLQTKVDGFRIELGDVEAALRALPGVRQAAGSVERDARGANRLVGYLVYEPSARPHEPAELRALLLDALPAYMVPSSFAVLDALPLTPNNKLDRKALAASARTAEPRRLVAPRNAVEEALLEIWKEAFQRDDIGATDDFFDLGGHSLLATQIHVKVVKVFRVEVPLRGLFRSRTVERLAALVVGGEAESGRGEKVARAYLSVKRMSPEERRRRLQQAGTAGAGPGRGGGL